MRWARRLADSMRDFQFECIAVAQSQARQLRQVVRYWTHRLSLVTQPRCLARKRVSDRQSARECLGVRQQESVHELSVPEVPSDRDVLPVPEREGIVAGDALNPASERARRIARDVLPQLE